MSKDVKFIVLVFLNISCVCLCGWYGIQNVVRSKELMNDLKIATNDSKANQLKAVKP